MVPAPAPVVPAPAPVVPAPAPDVPAPVAPAPVAPAPVGPKPIPQAAVADEPPQKSGNMGMMLGVGAVLVLVVVGVVFVPSVGAGAWVMVGDPTTTVVSAEPSDDSPVDPPVEVPTEAAPAEPDAAPSLGDVEPVDGARFLSMAAGTRKVSVRCEEGSASGSDSAVIEGDTFGDCTVTAVDGDRKRWVARVKEVKPVEYRCFVDGEKECNPSEG